MSKRSFTGLAAIVLTAALAWAYSTSVRGVFVYDDGAAIVANAHIRHLWPITDAMSAPPQATVSGRPIASLSLAINYALAPAEARDGVAPVGYHLFNLIVHLAAAM